LVEIRIGNFLLSCPEDETPNEAKHESSQEYIQNQRNQKNQEAGFGNIFFKVVCGV
jgi:hypothetical protein